MEKKLIDKAKMKEFLKATVGEKNFSMDPVMLIAFATDASRFESMPEAVVRPNSTEQISKIVRYCYENEIPVIPAGARTGCSGGIVAVYGGILLDLTSMNSVLKLDVDNLQVCVEPGIVNDKLNEFLKPYGFFVPGPASSYAATIGGMVGNDSSGKEAVNYGTTNAYVLKLEVVLPDGRIMTVGSNALKTASGLNLVGLFTGSEGVLGVFTKIWLRLIPLPEAEGIAMALFDQLENAGKAVINTFKAGIIPGCVEILDKSSIYAINLYKPELNLPDVEAMLLYEIKGSSFEIEPKINKIAEICKESGAIEVKKATEKAEINRLWEARSLVGAASVRVREGYARVYAGEDLTVPISKIPEMLTFLREASKRYDFPIVTFGHIGDGNLHPAITIRKEVAEDWPKLEALIEEINLKALELGGTVTGEHGIGIARARYLKKEHGEIALDVMRAIKQALDPKNIMNPGKMALGDDPEVILSKIPDRTI
ncbi:MAG: FAD-binding oxidoreductase [Promethearchaeota archaeon]